MQQQKMQDMAEENKARRKEGNEETKGGFILRSRPEQEIPSLLHKDTPHDNDHLGWIETDAFTVLIVGT